MTKQGTFKAEHLERMNASDEAPSTSCHDSKITREELTPRNISSENSDELNKFSTDKFQTPQSRWHDLLASRLGGSHTRVNVLEDVGCSSKSELDRDTLNNQRSVDTASHGDATGRFNGGEMSNLKTDLVCITKPALSDRNSPENNCNEVKETGSQIASGSALRSSSCTQTKILSKSGITQYFVKDTLKDKGILCRGPAPHSVIPTSGTLLNSNRENGVAPSRAIPNQVTKLNRVTAGPPPHVIHRQTAMPLSTHAAPSPGRQTVMPLRQGNINPVQQTVAPLLQDIPDPQIGRHHAIPSPFPNSNNETVMLHHDGVSLREWLEFGENNRNKLKSLNIFKQIVDAVSDFHSKGIILLDLRPSYFKLMPSNKVTYTGSNFQIENFCDQDANKKPNYQNEKRPMGYSNIPDAKRIKLGENPKLVISEPQLPNKLGVAADNGNNVRHGCPQFIGNQFCDKSKPTQVCVTESDSGGVNISNSFRIVIGSAKNTSEEVKWYASPEELNKGQCMLSSNIYSLGIFLVELLCSFNSERARDFVIRDLRNYIIPLDFMEENSREAALCAWLLRPEPSLRPPIREVLNSDVIKEIEDLTNSSSSSNLDDVESELLLLHFLESLQQQKQDRSSELMEEIKLLDADIEEVERRRKMSFLPEKLVHARGEVSGQSSSGVNCDKYAPFCNKERLMKNIGKLENFYFSMRSTVDSSNNGPVRCDVKDLLECQETFYQEKKDGELKKVTEGLGVFYNGVCKYARYTKFKVCGTLRNGTINNSNIVSSLSFDPNEDHFAAAGVSKKIKIYEFHAVLNNSVDIHYPVIEMSNKSKLSCTSWNKYIRNRLASTDYDGVVKLWDAGTGKEVNQYIEHRRRAWSVDFSQVHPTTLASASDDRCVKLWDIAQKGSVMTIGNDAKLCCVQFSGKSSHVLAFGSANHNTYCFDLRNSTKPWCTLVGHASAVSYVKFLDSKTLISASTDNTLKIWDLYSTSATVVPNKGCISTLSGHTNREKFVGLSVTDDGYIMCGSETNEVFAYHRFLPMPITSHKFGSADPITGKETDGDAGHFISNVCSQKESGLVVAANSSGTIKLLQMV